MAFFRDVCKVNRKLLTHNTPLLVYLYFLINCAPSGRYIHVCFHFNGKYMNVSINAVHIYQDPSEKIKELEDLTLLMKKFFPSRAIFSKKKHTKLKKAP